MEEWVGQWWHKAITRIAATPPNPARVQLADVQRSIALLYRAGGGDPAVRVAPAAASRHGGARRWIERVAGSNQRSAQSRLDPEVLALPPEIAVFDNRPLNHDLYLWLAALAAVFEPTGDWIADNRAASSRALQRFAGLRSRHAALLQAHLAQRPPLASLRAAAAPFEAAVQANDALADFRLTQCGRPGPRRLAVCPPRHVGRQGRPFTLALLEGRTTGEQKGRQQGREEQAAHWISPERGKPA